VVQRFVNASLEGWAEYMKGGAAIEAANAAIRKDNPDMTDDKMAYALKVMNERGIVKSGDALKLGIGAMTDARWKRFYDTMSDTGVFPKGLDVKKAYSLEFINKGIGA
jgi:NitT/TauT family transport system substrate-binding protein